jgi:hypothetical protein
MFLFFALLLVFAASSARDLNVFDDFVKAEASFAVDELSKLSDSGVYTSLRLKNIVSAHQENGIFHKNTMLTLELSSPHFNSASDTEIFDVVVMTHHDDGVKSIAISEFPVMAEASIESFWIQKVEEKRIAREEAFRRLEVRAVLQARQPAHSEGKSKNEPLLVDTSIDTEGLPVDYLLDLVDFADLAAARRAVSADTIPRLAEPFATQEAALAAMSLKQLYVVSVSPRGGEYSDFQRERARLLVDAHLRQAGEV